MMRKEHPVNKPCSSEEDARLKVMGKLGLVPEGITVSSLVRGIRDAPEAFQLKAAEALLARVRKLERLSGRLWSFDQKIAEWEDYHSALDEYNTQCLFEDDLEVVRNLRSSFAYA